jgi:NAD+ kinase
MVSPTLSPASRATLPAGRKKRRVLVIYKKSAFQLYVRERKNQHIAALIEQQNRSVQRMYEAHVEHEQSVQIAKDVLRKLGVRPVFRYRKDVRSSDEFQLVVTLGGDGTLLWASHIVDASLPVVAINTAPRDSVGYFCAGTRDDMASLFSDALHGTLPETRLQRMQVELDGQVLSQRVLNDALFCHLSPAATSRYLLRVGDVEEEHKSSGIWVGPAAGSTAAQHSAGGRVLPVDSTDLQYVVRELYNPQRKPLALVRGTFGPGTHLTVQSKIRDGRLFLDGPHRRYAVAMGGTVRMSLSPEPMTLLGFRRKDPPLANL